MIKYHSIFSFHHIAIPYSKYVQTFERQEIAHFYVIDLSEEHTKENVIKSGLLTKEGFQEFSENTLAEFFYHAKSPIRFNLNVLFVLPDEMQLTDDMWEMRENKEYARKLFLKASAFSKLLLEQEKKEICMNVATKEERYKLYNFNVVSNSFAKSSLDLLQELASSLKSSVFQVGYPAEEIYIESIKNANPQQLSYYYQKLWSMFQEQGIPENPMALSFTEKRCLYLASILSSHAKGKPILLDGISWGSLDNERLLNFISTLNDFSMQSGSVIVTCDSKATNNLIKKKVYRANFIVSK